MNHKVLLRSQYYILLIFVCCLFPNISYSQFPVGKNIQVARSEIKQLMKTKGYTYLKKEEHKDIKIEILYFSEEFMVTLKKNNYDNVESVNITSEKKKVMDRLKTIFNFPQWKYIESTSDSWGVDRIYYYKNYHITMPENLSIHQFIVRIKDDN